MATISNRKLQKIITLPINQVFRYFTAKEKVEIWLMDRNNSRITGVIRGFDEYMNMVLDDSEECFFNKETNEFDQKTVLGQIMLKGENIVAISPCSAHGPLTGGAQAEVSSEPVKGEDLPQNPA